MGTYISLDVAGLTVDLAKNTRGNDHGFLFQKGDRRCLSSDQYEHDCFDSDDPELADMEMGFAKSLGELVPRLELLGFGVDSIELEYRHVADTYRQQTRDDDTDHSCDLMEFDEFRKFVATYSIMELDDDYDGTVDQEAVAGRFRDETKKCRIPGYPQYDSTSYSERSYFGNLIGILHPYSILRLLAGNDENCQALVTWQYGPLVHAGWADWTEFVPEARKTQTFLIATEGSCDAHILRHAFSLLRPEIADFFRFIDMSSGHPFPGAGNLVRFASGLSKIDVHNQVVFLLDNDCEGVEAQGKINDLGLHANMRALVLPERGEFRAFRTRGPDGVRTTDINRRAASIECYLDLEVTGLPSAEVVWSTYKKQLDAYQGALKGKRVYAKAFLKLNTESLKEDVYDVSKMLAVLDEIFRCCSSIAAAGRFPASMK